MPSPCPAKTGVLRKRPAGKPRVSHKLAETVNFSFSSSSTFVSSPTALSSERMKAYVRRGLIIESRPNEHQDKHLTSESGLLVPSSSMVRGCSDSCKRKPSDEEVYPDLKRLRLQQQPSFEREAYQATCIAKCVCGVADAASSNNLASLLFPPGIARPPKQDEV